MLNNLDDLKKQINANLDAAKKANNTALTTQLQGLQTARQGLEDTLGTDVQGEGTLQENHLREDVQTAYFSAQGLNTPAVVSYINRINADFRAGIDRYNAFVRSQV